MANTRRHRYAVSSLMDTVYWLSEQAFQNGDMIYFENYEWYENLEDGELKNKALNSKAIFEGSKGVDKESSDKAGNFCSTINEWEDFEHANHKGADTNSSYNPYLDVSRIFNDHAGTNNTYETQDNEEWFDDNKRMKNDDDDIGDLGQTIDR
ncbi:hypothetical protein Tco_0737927 [Tanacetum coccineum]